MSIACSSDKKPVDGDVVIQSDDLVVDLLRPIRLTDEARIPESDPSLTSVDAIEVSPDAVRFHYAEEPTIRLEPGNVIAGQAGNGYLRRVLSVATPSDNVVEVATEHAFVTDLILDGHFSVLAQPAATSWVEGEALALSTGEEAKVRFFTPELIAGLQCNLQGVGSVELTPSLEVIPKFEFELDINPDADSIKGALNYGIVAAGLQVDLGIDVESTNEVGGACSLDIVSAIEENSSIELTKSLPTLRFLLPTPLGPLPVFITSEIGPTASLELSLNTVTDKSVTNSSIHLETRIGAEYDGEWRAIWEEPDPTGSVGHSEPNAIGETSIGAEASMGLEVKAFIWDVAGPKLGAEVYLSAEAAADAAVCEWEASVSAGLKATAGVEIQIPVMELTLADFSKSFTVVEAEIASTSGSLCTEPPTETGPNRILFTSNRNGAQDIYVMNVDGSNQTNLTNQAEPDSAAVGSPDGTKIAFASDRDGNREIYVMDADGSNQTRLTVTAVGGNDQPAWSPDGSQIAFVKRVDAQNEIFLMDADGGNEVRLTTNAASDNAPVWSPDGTQIAFHSDRDGNQEIYRMLATGTGVTRLTTNAGFDTDPSWSPDGLNIIFSRGFPAAQVYSISAADGSNAVNLSTPATGDQRPNWSPGGEFIAYDRGGEIFVMDADGSNQTNVSNDVAFDDTPAWLPAALPSKIVFRSQRDGDDEIYVMDGDGGSPTRLTDSLESDRDPSWSYDRTKIAFGSSRGGAEQIYVMDADGSNQVNISSNAFTDYQPSWSPDGTQIVFTSFRDGGFSEIYVMDSDGGNPQRLTTNGDTDNTPTWSPDGAQILFFSNRASSANLYVMDTAGGNLVNLTADSVEIDVAPAWSPDGTQIAFQSLRNGNWDIWVMNADGSGKATVSAATSPDKFPSWSPDGNQIVFQSNDTGSNTSTSQIFVVNKDGSGRTRLSTADTFTDNDVCWSP